MQSYYGRQTPNQMKSVLTRPVAGLNEYAPNISINDNIMSDILDVSSYRDSAMYFSKPTSTPINLIPDLLSTSNVDGEVKEAVGINGYVSNLISTQGYVAMVYDTAISLWTMRRIREGISEVLSYPIPSYGMPIENLMQEPDVGTSVATWPNANCTSAAYNSTNCTFIASAQDGGITSLGQNVTNGHKYCLVVHVNNPAANAVHMKWARAAQTGDIYSATTGVIDLSDVFTVSASTGTLSVSIVDNRASGWNAVVAYYAVLIDVTYDSEIDATIKAWTIALGNLSDVDASSIYTYDSCIFNTLDKQYMCFTCSKSKRIYYFESINLTYGFIEIPFYPKKIVSHANRIFAIDTGNTLWGCSVGDLFSWYSNEYDNDAVMASANMQVGAYSSLIQPVIPKPFTATSTPVGAADTMGTLAVVGTNVLDQVQTETITPISGQRVQGLKIFKTYTSVTGAGWVINGTADTITFGNAPTGGFVVDDEVYWPLEQEHELSDICVVSENIYIFAPNNVYVFRGYSYDTFSMTRLLVDIGIISTGGIYIGARKLLATSNNIAYFYNNGDIYEFNGSDYPKLISHPEFVNGNLQNGLYSGIATLTTDISLVADSNFLYVYNPTASSNLGNYYYKFDFANRAWSKHSRVFATYDLTRIMVPNADNSSVVLFLNCYNLPDFQFKLYTTLVKYQSVLPYVITKAFNTNPSELGTLTSIILQVKGTSLATSDIVLYYSLTTDGAFTEFKRYTAYVFNGDIENLDIPIPCAYIANAHHYRIKIEVGSSMYLYDIERRFRVRGRTR